MVVIRQTTTGGTPMLSDYEARRPTTYLLKEPRLEPTPIPGCGGCLSICVRRENCRSVGDFSGVSDCNVELREHQDARHCA
ncbi:hypothetical protein GCM10010329_50560 [Streptomyces spiroverticillatus]|uniref:Uncharacterized protein n=1 Tax=Streptomyces finlayi TaxID=67296 RepID=A0A919CC41_9ACTN|nr:hypothetical protein GCM10010329_50560 [Streptomyces spiroverticillatus]GHD03547.1 hypothetical protein GCM10010334_51510 [Streptomyces finlayi]